MSDNEGQIQSTIVDVGKLIASIAILLSSIVVYYSFPQISIVIRALAIIFALAMKGIEKQGKAMKNNEKPWKAMEKL